MRWRVGLLAREDTPRPGPAEDTAWESLCIDCVLDSLPGIGRGLDLAREHGSASLAAAGGWEAGEL